MAPNGTNATVAIDENVDLNNLDAVPQFFVACINPNELAADSDLSEHKLTDAFVKMSAGLLHGMHRDFDRDLQRRFAHPRSKVFAQGAAATVVARVKRGHAEKLRAAVNSAEMRTRVLSAKRAMYDGAKEATVVLIGEGKDVLELVNEHCIRETIVRGSTAE